MVGLRVPSSIVAAAVVLSFLTSMQFVAAQSAGSASPAPATGTSGAGQQPDAPPIPANSPHMERQTRLEIIRDFEAQLVYARAAFPMGTKGVQLKQGVVTPNGEELRQSLAMW